MLFNSYIFVLAFLPIILCGFYLLAPYDKKWRIYWLTAGSFLFYGWWNPAYLILLIISILTNFTLGQFIIKTGKKLYMIIGIIFNLCLIGYYKYAAFILTFIGLENGAGGFAFENILLPLGISFFTFQQIAYLVDCYQKKVVHHNLREYSLFVSFFPQLIAGPIVHQKEILPQLTKPKLSIYSGLFAMGLTLFILGLSKKTILADPLGNIATPLFDQSLTSPLGFADSWLAAFSYTLQLYFDFSAYSDMAIGLGLMFGIKLPLNFYSPYKSLNIIDFWRRWHITLSRFLRDYLYIPLGGNRHGKTRRYINLFITMLLGGLWHGAGWTFVLWGGLHGAYLVINHVWNATGKSMPKILAWLITFMAVVIAWVLFRAENFDSAVHVYQGMITPSIPHIDLTQCLQWAMVISGLIVALAFPNLYEWLKMRTYDLNKEKWESQKFWTLRVPAFGRWKPTALQGLGLGIALWVCLLAIQFVQSEFLYFNF